MTIKETQAVYYTTETVDDLIKTISALLEELESGVVGVEAEALMNRTKMLLGKVTPPEQDPLVIGG